MVVNSAMNKATTAAMAAGRSTRPFRRYAGHANAYATTASPAASIDPDHATDGTRAQAYTTTAAAITPAACRSLASTASDAALTARVSTPRAPNSGHGGTDHWGCTAMKNRNAWPSSPRYVPRRKPTPRIVAGVPAVCVCAHAWPASITSVSKTSTSSDGNSPTAPAALPHHTASPQPRQRAATDRHPRQRARRAFDEDAGVEEREQHREAP